MDQMLACVARVGMHKLMHGCWLLWVRMVVVDQASDCCRCELVAIVGLVFGVLALCWCIKPLG